MLDVYAQQAYIEHMSTEYQIDKDIPIPPKIRGKAGEVAITLGAMEVGDSFVFEDNANKGQQLRIKYAAQKLGMRITVRRLGDSQFRAWRVA